MSCLESFLNKPVLLQLVDPIAASHSSEEVTLEDTSDSEGHPIKCGRAIMSMQMQGVINPQTGQPVVDPRTNSPMSREQPILIQIVRGEIVEIGDDGIMFATVGGDNKTQVIIYVPNRGIRAITFALEHVEQVVKSEPSIIVPN